MSDEERKVIEYFKRRIANKKTAYTSIYFKIKKLDELINLIEKQSKEIEELEEQCKEVVCVPEGTCFMIKPKDVDKKWKDKIKAILGIEDNSDENILTVLQTIVDENARLEDIEDRKVQIDYNNVFNKGVKSVEDKIKAKIEEYGNKIKKIRSKKVINEPEDTIIITRYAHYISVLQSLLEKE